MVYRLGMLMAQSHVEELKMDKKAAGAGIVALETGWVEGTDTGDVGTGAVSSETEGVEGTTNRGKVGIMCDSGIEIPGLICLGIATEGWPNRQKQVQVVTEDRFWQQKTVKAAVEIEMVAGGGIRRRQTAIGEKEGEISLAGKVAGLKKFRQRVEAALSLLGKATKGNKIAILSFEVANTIVKGTTLVQSLSMDNIKHLKEVVLPSEGVQLLISKDMNKLLRIAASDKREELKIVSGEVVRFGNRCKDPQWHNLDRYFEKLRSELTPQKQLKKAESSMERLKNLVQYTAELYHELHELDRLEQVFKRKQIEQENPNAPSRGGSLAILRAEMKSQKKHVRSLQKKSLWSMVFEEVMEQLVDIVHFIHMKIQYAFGTADTHTPVKNNPRKLGAAGLSLRYANIITQIDTLVTHSGSVHPDIRDSLYQGLPPNIKSAMRSKIHLFYPKVELSIPAIRAEMEKTLQWLVPIAMNTTKAHHGFGWVGEWANTGFEATRKLSYLVDSLKIETLHHANKEKTEKCILKVVVLLHHLVSVKSCGTTLPAKSPIRSPNKTRIQRSMNRPDSLSPTLTTEDQEMLQDVIKRKPALVISKSQNSDRDRLSKQKQYRLTKSRSYSSNREIKRGPIPNERRSSIPMPLINFDIDAIDAVIV
ncbi:protein PSK SIMULATOR 1-like [Bidens hawaiensis]|uniref:protein PSK SIMULATOR 1-like n=1 Tax=Bidens hawaiensis TaxID=980011 RepID=UPI00404A443E